MRPEDRLTDCPEKQVGVKIPLPLDQKLYDLVSLAREQGFRGATRKAVIGMLIANAEFDRPSIAAALIRYHTSTVGEIPPVTN